LIQSLADTNFYVRFAASFALIGMTNSAISSALEALFNDPEPRVRTAAAISVAFHGSTRAIPQLATTLRCRDDWQRLAAAMSLLRLNTPEARELVRSLNNDRDASLRELALLGLERGPMGALTNMLAQGTDDHRHYAARMLLFFDDPAAIPALREALRDPRADVRVASRVTLRRLERHAAVH
jgi:HEAT repeat protein